MRPTVDAIDETETGIFRRQAGNLPGIPTFFEFF